MSDPTFSTELRRAIIDCRDRGLIAASKWAAELLNSIPVQNRSILDFNPLAPPSQGGPLAFHTSTPSRDVPRSAYGRPSLSTMSPSEFMERPPIPPPTSAAEEQLAAVEEDTFNLGKAYFDSKELERCAWALKESKSPKASFLRLYAQYLSADKRMQEGLPTLMGGPDDRHTLSPSFLPILKELESSLDPFFLYLRGTILARLHKKAEAAECYIKSIEAYPCNWSCWLALAGCIKSTIELEMLLPLLPRNHVFVKCFEIHCRLDLHTATDEVNLLIDDLTVEPFSIEQSTKDAAQKKIWVWGSAMKGMVAYHLRDFELAEKEFDNVQEKDPYRLDDIDIYSNMLYVMPKLSKLAQLAKDYCMIDRNRAETCCLIGNYYSSRGEHGKAITYYKRSLQLNRDYLPAWTLMGHEYVEMKNSHAAIEAYRRAVDINPRDYRAWYGLGQTYELLDMAHYAIQYFNKATALRPYDSRMWLALAQVYENNGRTAEAIKCHQRGLVGADPGETVNGILTTLARLFDSIGNQAEAAAWHRRLLTSWAGNGPVGEMVASWLYLAKYELKGGDAGQEPNYSLADSYLQNIVKHNVTERDQAEALLKEIADRNFA